MQIVFREARHDDVPQIVALLADDVLGSGRENAKAEIYLAAFDAMMSEPGNRSYVAVLGERVVATYQLVFINGLSLQAARRAQIESVRVASDLRGAGLGRKLVADAEARSRAAGCALMQLTSNESRAEALRFYESCGFSGSHVGFKKSLV